MNNGCQNDELAAARPAKLKKHVPPCEAECREREKYLEFRLVRYYSRALFVREREARERDILRLNVLRGGNNFFFREIIDVQSRQVLESMQARARGLHAGMDDASGGQIFTGVSGDPGKAYFSRNV
jgi:hypothetical protein